MFEGRQVTCLMLERKQNREPLKEIKKSRNSDILQIEDSTSVEEFSCTRDLASALNQIQRVYESKDLKKRLSEPLSLC